MAGTLADLAVMSSDKYERGVIERFKLTSDFISLLPQKTSQGTTYKYRVEEVAPGVAWRDVNEAYAESTGVIAPRIESTMIVGGDVFLDNALLRNQRSGGDAVDLKAEQYDLKARALARELERAYFEGDDLVNPKEMPGLRRRLTGAQVLVCNTTTPTASSVLTLDAIDRLIDALDGSIGTIHLFMNLGNARKLTNLVLQASGALQIQYGSVNDTERIIMRYGTAQVHTVIDGWDASTLLAFDEWPGSGSADGSSIYGCIFDEDMGVCGLLSGGTGGDPLVDVREVGETTSPSVAPGLMGRIELYPGLMI